MTADVCPAFGFRTPTRIEAVPEGTLRLHWSSVAERKVVAAFTPATCNCEPETNPVPLSVSIKLVPGAVCVTEPAVIVGRGFRTLTLTEAEPAGFATVTAPIVTE